MQASQIEHTCHKCDRCNEKEKSFFELLKKQAHTCWQCKACNLKKRDKCIHVFERVAEISHHQRCRYCRLDDPECACKDCLGYE